MVYRAFLSALAAIVSLAGIAAGQSDVSPQNDILHYACHDVVIIGRIRDQTMTPITDADDLIGHGHIDMAIDVRRILAGVIAVPTIRASSIAHTLSREDHDFLLVLRPAPAGRYTVQGGQIVEDGDGGEPAIAKSCS